LKKVNEDHWGVVDAIKNELTSAPMDPMHGYIQGQVLQLLQENCEDLEEELETMESAEVMEERRVCQMKVCAAQADGTAKLTVTVPLHKVRMEKENGMIPCSLSTNL